MWTAEAEQGLEDLVATLLGVPCRWRGRPAPMVAGASATLDAISEVSVGQPETEREIEDGELTPTTYGLREASLQVSVWSPSQEPGQAARTYTSRLRTRLGWPSSIEALAALGIGIVSVGSATPVSSEEFGRDRTGSALELRVCFGVGESDAPVPYVETVHVHSVDPEDEEIGIRDAAGELLPTSIQHDLNTEP